MEEPSEQWTAKPTFWFELMPESWSYGMGYYMPKALTMAKLRARLDRDPKTMEALTRTLEKQEEFRLETEAYKRPKGPQLMLVSLTTLLYLNTCKRQNFFSSNLPNNKVQGPSQ